MQEFRPFGLQFSGSLTGEHSNVQRAYPTRNGSTCPNLHRGAPVRLVGGHVTSVGASPVGAWLGVANGFAYVDPVNGPRFVSYLPAATSSSGTIDGDNRPQVYVIDNPDATFWIQANASVSAGDLGLNFEVTTLGESDLYGQSRYALHATTRTSAASAPVKVVGLARIPGNAWDNPYPIVEVKINVPVVTQLSAGV